MLLFQMAVANALRRPVRAALTTCGVALGIGAFVALVGFAQSFETQWLRYYSTRATDLIVFRGSAGSLLSKASMAESLAEKLRGLAGVANVVPVSFDLVDFTPETSGILQGWGNASYELDSLNVVQGRKLREDEPGIMLGEILAQDVGKKAGEWLDLQGEHVQIVGIYRSEDSLSASSAVMPLHRFQALLGVGPTVAGFHVRLQPAPTGQSAEEHVRRAQALIESQLPGVRAMSVEAAVRNSHTTHFLRSTAWAISLIALLIAVLGVANTMAMSVFERTREIGLLRAVGWKRSRVMRLILLEASLVGLSGGLLGLLAGYFGPSALRFIRASGGLPQADPSLVHFGEAMLLALGISVAAGFLPAYRAARCSPIAALRHE